MRCPTAPFRASSRSLRLASLVLSLSAALVPAARAERPAPTRFAAAEVANGAASIPARSQSASSYDALWTGYPLPNVVGNIYAMISYGGGLVVASGGDAFGTTTSHRVALWDGVGWHSMGGGVSTTIYSFAIRGGQLLAAGAGGSGDLPGSGEKPAIFAWDGNAWTAIGSANGAINSMVVVGSDLCVGGSFVSIDGVAAGKIARWDGANWYPVGTGLGSGALSSVKTLALHGAALVAGGNIAPYQGVAQWNGANWTQIGSGLQNGAFAGTVNALVSDGTILYAAGTFNASGGSAVTNVAAWNGTSWGGLAGATASSNAIALYAGSPMATVLDGAIRRPQLWNGSAWQPFNQANVDPLGYALDGATLYAGGYLSQGGGTTPTVLGGFCSFDGSAWTAVQQAWTPDMRGLSGIGYCAQEYHGSLFVGGVFTYVGMGDHFQYSPGAASWDGANWTAVGAGGQHFDMAVWSDSLVACMDGWVKVWNGATWRRLAPTQTTAYTFDWTTGLAVYDGDLIVLGPQYLNAGSVPLYGLARWTGATWVPLGGGVDTDAGDWPYAATQWGSNFAIGGALTSAGGTPVRNLTYWDGAAYHDLGGGVNGVVLTLLADGSDLLVGGDFTEAGGDSVKGVARWDGAAWHAMGTRARVINRLRSHAGRIYAAGTFLDDDSHVVGGAAVWTGTEWNLLGSGVNPYGSVYNLEFLGDDLYLVGSFNSANGHAARNFARLPNVSTLAVGPPDRHATRLALAPSPNPSRGSVRLAVTLPAAGRVRLAIHDLAGRELARLLGGEHAAGSFSLAWDARVAPGLYFATLESAGERTTTRLVRLQ